MAAMAGQTECVELLLKAKAPFFFPDQYGSVSKPCTPGEHQNRWQMDVHPPKNGINRY
jgi:hypothetical protein